MLLNSSSSLVGANSGGAAVVVVLCDGSVAALGCTGMFLRGEVFEWILVGLELVSTADLLLQAPILLENSTALLADCLSYLTL